MREASIFISVENPDIHKRTEKQATEAVNNGISVTNNESPFSASLL